GVAAGLHGSGFLAVLVTGILIGDAAAPHKGEVGRFHSGLASLAEIAAFVALGLTVNLGFIFDANLWLDGLVVAAVLAIVARAPRAGGAVVPRPRAAGG